MSPQTQNLLITAGVLSVITTILVLWNTPNPNQYNEKQNKTGNLIKVLLLSFGLCALVLYIMQDNDQNSMMTNIIQGEPDF